ncbi:MAG: twin-arginine translocation signal domain-containing protein [Kiritimatiellae bacterium]|nr:twin-arginine translocation signal domain-containing protein [Kiritimatiellia bacterium]
MTERMERRSFLKCAALTGAALAAGGASADAKTPVHPTMAGFAAPPMERIRIAFIGIGER